MEIKFTFLVLMQKVPLHELCLSPQPVLDVLERGWNLRQVFKEFWEVTGMAPDFSAELLSFIIQLCLFDTSIDTPSLNKR